MAELIAFLAALPLLYGIGRFYWRLGGWLCLTGRQAAAASRRPSCPHDRAMQSGGMPEESRYFAALETARAILEELATRPDMPPHARLATVTFLLLGAMDRWEEAKGGNAGHCV